MNIKKGDNLFILSGRDRGKTGIISQIINPNKVVVKGINIIKIHQKKTRTRPQGGIIEKYAPIFTSKVQIICPACNKITRVGHFNPTPTEKIRICRHCQSSLDEVKSAESKVTINKK